LQDPKPAESTALQSQLTDALATLFAPWVGELKLQVLQAEPGLVQLALPVAPQHVHAAGVLCGQTLMAAADTAMVLAVISQLGHFKPMSTVQLNTSFLRPVPGAGGQVQLTARVLRMGRSLVFGEVHLHTPDGHLAAQVTTTYALL
jgi:uncharacterized protein (TIGR00369 family)